VGFWGYLFGKDKTIRVDDAFFGKMLLVESVKNPVDNYFECQRYFGPSRNIIELSVTGVLNGPTQQQKDFFTQIEKDYLLLVVKFIPLIEEGFGAWMMLPIIKDFEKEFKPTYLSIPTCDQHPIEWEIAFDTVHDLNHMVTVGMVGYEPRFVRIDG
jgi:hypothetical protein